MHNDYNLTLTYTYAAAADQLFDAWIDPAQMQQWFRLNDDTITHHAENDLRTGGDYRLDVQSADGTTTHISGLYHQIERPSFLAFTWRWGDETEAEDTYVELRFKEADNQTKLTLLHDEFLTAAERDRHEAFWHDALDRLAQHLSAS